MFVSDDCWIILHLANTRVSTRNTPFEAGHTLLRLHTFASPPLLGARGCLYTIQNFIASDLLFCFAGTARLRSVFEMEPLVILLQADDF